jgi:hypothetical protein
MITIVCWKWESAKEYRSKFTSEHVRTLASMIARNTTVPYRIVCVTDDVKSVWGIPKVEPFEIWKEPEVFVPSPHTNCYRRLKLFDKDLPRNIFGSRVLSIDLDCVIVGNIDHILTEKSDFCGWSMKVMPFNGSLWSLKVGAKPEVWDDFKGQESRDMASALGYLGSDQAWMSYKLNNSGKQYTPENHGVFSWKRHIKGKGLPENASIVFFHGVPDPWDPSLKGIPEAKFISEHYR